MPEKTKTAKNEKKSPVFTYDFDVVGLGFRLKREARRALADTLDRKQKIGHDGIESIKLVREQENKYDPNAIRVIHPDTGALAGKHLGYLRADAAQLIAPLMDKGKDGGLVFKRATLIELHEDDDLKTGVVHTVFDDCR